jgi:hypothetical protein
MLGSITDWTATFREAFTACTPGGWVESYEVSSTMESDDNSIPDGSAMKRWGEVFEEGGQRAGRSFAIIREDVQRKSMEEAGFVNIHVVDLKVGYLYTPAKFLDQFNSVATGTSWSLAYGRTAQASWAIYAGCSGERLRRVPSVPSVRAFGMDRGTGQSSVHPAPARDSIGSTSSVFQTKNCLRSEA